MSSGHKPGDESCVSVKEFDEDCFVVHIMVLHTMIGQNGVQERRWEHFHVLLQELHMYLR